MAYVMQTGVIGPAVLPEPLVSRRERGSDRQGSNLRFRRVNQRHDRYCDLAYERDRTDPVAKWQDMPGEEASGLSHLLAADLSRAGSLFLVELRLGSRVLLITEGPCVDCC